MGGRFWPPDSHCTIGHGIAHGPPGPRWLTARRSCSASSLARIVSARVRLARPWPAAPPARAARACASTALARRQAGGDRRQRVAARRSDAAAARWRCLELGQHVALVARVGARVAHEADDLLVGALDAVQELDGSSRSAKPWTLKTTVTRSGGGFSYWLRRTTASWRRTLTRRRRRAHRAAALVVEPASGALLARLGIVELGLGGAQPALEDRDECAVLALELAMREIAEDSDLLARLARADRVAQLRLALGRVAAARSASRPATATTASVSTAVRGSKRDRVSTAAAADQR